MTTNNSLMGRLFRQRRRGWAGPAGAVRRVTSSLEYCDVSQMSGGANERFRNNCKSAKNQSIGKPLIISQLTKPGSDPPHFMLAALQRIPWFASISYPLVVRSIKTPWSHITPELLFACRRSSPLGYYVNVYIFIGGSKPSSLVS